MCRRPVALFTPRKIGKFCSKVPINRRNALPSFRRQNVSAATFFAVSPARCGRSGEIIRCDARSGGSAATFFAVSSARCDRIGGNVFRRFVCTL